MMQLFRQPRIKTLIVQHGHLHATTSQGSLPLYLYAPLRSAILCGQGVPFAANWPEHLKLFVYGYVPVPRLEPANLPAEIAAHVSWQARDHGGLRPYEQATFKGWPLYTAQHDTINEAAHSAIPDAFQAVSLDIDALPNHNLMAIHPPPPPVGP